MSSFREYKDDVASRAHLVKDTVTQLPRIGIVVGTTVYVKENDTVYIWNGAGWYSIVTTSDTWVVDVTQITYDSKSFSVASQENAPTTVAFNSDGTKMYILGLTNATIYQYTLSTAYDVSTASYDSVSFNASSQGASLHDMAFNNDGTKMYILGDNAENVYQYSLSTAYSISTASYDSVSFDVSSQETSPYSMTFSGDGTKMYILGYGSATAYQYSLSTAYNISTASYDSVSFDASSQVSNGAGLRFNSDGTKMYILDRSSPYGVYQYTLSTAYNISTASYDSVSFTVAQDTVPFGLTFRSDGIKMYIVGYGNDTIYQYSTGL